MDIPYKSTHYVMDFETLQNCFAGIFEEFLQGSNVTHEFVIHKTRNDLDKLLDFLDRSRKLKELHISYNGISFDSQITQYIMVNRALLGFMTNDECARAIYAQAQEVIRRSRAKEWPMYQEKKLFIGQIDIFKTNHWDNVNKSASLKWLQYAIDWPNLQEMPIHHTTEINTKEEIDEILSYCRNDVSSTKHILHLCKKQINLRKSIGSKYGMTCYNYSNTKIGSELLLNLYCNKTGQDPWIVRKSGTKRESIILKDILFPYIEFKSKEFQELHELVQDTVVYNTKNGFKKTQHFKGYEFEYGLGGIHQSVAGIYESDEEYIIRDVDVASLYPSIAVQNGMYPAHLGPAFFEVYKNDIVGVRLAEKAKGKDGDIAIIEGFKEAANATYGNSNSQYSWLYDPQYTMQTTINGQLLITMLVEDLLLAFPDAQLLQTNTDGITMRLKRTDLPRYDAICKEWEKKTKLILEFADYKKMFIWDINNYIATYDDPKKTPKCKGRFEWEDLQNHKPTHLHKNKSFLIVSKAIFQYFVNDVLPETYIVENRNIYDYCGVSRIKGDWKFEEIKIVQNVPEEFRAFTQEQKEDYLRSNGWQESWGPDNWVRSDPQYSQEANNGIPTNYAFAYVVQKEAVFQRTELQNTIRYYISEDGFKIIKKHKTDNREIQNQAGRWLQTVFNKYYKAEWADYKVNDAFYLQEIYKEINNIQPNKAAGSQMKLDFD